MIMMIRRNPYQEGQEKINFIDEQLVKMNIPLNDDNRCEYIAGQQGILGQSLNAILEGVRQGFLDRMHFIEYKNLVSTPYETLQEIYEFLEEEPFEHTFDNLKNQSRERDLYTYGLKDMHEVRSSLESTAPNPKDILSQQIIEKCKGMDIWRRNFQ
jgi:sulfotransferase